MRAFIWIVVAAMSVGVSFGCAEESSGGGGGTGATGALGGTSGVGATAGVGGSAGSVGGTAGVGGAGTGGAGTGGDAGTGASAGQGGTAGSGATGGVGGSAGTTGGAGGAGGSAGTTGGTGGTTGGAGGGGGMGDFVGDVNIAIHPDVNTILVVTWQQLLAADTTWLEFTFEAGNVMTSRPKPAALGAHKDVVLGVPGETAVTVRIVNSLGGVEYKSMDYQGTTGAVPSSMPKPTVLSYDAAIASPDRWMFGGVEDSQISGSSERPGYYRYTFWTYIMDRKGRIVWYYSDPGSNAITSFQRVARDGEYIWVEKTGHHTTTQDTVIKMTLDREYYEEVSLEFTDCIDVTDDGSLLYDQENPGILKELTKAGQTRDVFNCSDHFGSGFDCYTNTVNWSAADDTVVMSYPRETTVVQVSRQTGEVVGQYGTASGSYTFEPNTWTFEFQHFPNISKDGTLMVSTHLPGNDNTQNPVANQHAFAEFTIDRTNRKLIEKWVYTEGPEWAMYKGMTMRLPNGNTIGNYGTGGFIREITPDKKTAFHVKFDVPTGDDFFNKMVGHNVLIDDLYALNGGPK